MSSSHFTAKVRAAIVFFIMAPWGNALAQSETETASASVSAGLATAFSRADIALAKSRINLSHLKGDLAESLVEEHYLQRHRLTKSDWRPETPRFGRQGIDQIYVKYDRMGNPRRLLAIEVKYGSSSLRMTRDGRQIGRKWTNKRLLALAQRYREIASGARIAARSPSTAAAPRHVVRVSLDTGSEAFFWRENSSKPWKFAGRANDLAKAQSHAQVKAQFLSAAGRGVISVDRRLVEVKPNGREFILSVKDASSLDNGRPAKLLPSEVRVIPRNAIEHRAHLEVSRYLSRSLPNLAAADVDDLSRGISRRTTHDNPFANYERPLGASILRNTMKAGLFGGVLLVALEGAQQTMSGEADLASMVNAAVLGAVAVGGGTALGQVATANFVQRRFLAEAAASPGARLTWSAGGVGGFTGASAAGLLLAYGGWLSGAHDLDTANRAASIALAGSAGGTLAYLATLGVASAYGVAGTGAAITGLSGIAATNASLAWLGGGSLAAGGGGVATGSLVLAGIGLVGFVAATGMALYVVSWLDEADQQELLRRQLAFYTSDPRAFRSYEVIAR